MPDASRKFLLGLVVSLSLGAAVGWLYGHADWGLLLAALMVLIWQARNLVSFDRAMHSGNFSLFRLGDGIWPKIFSRFRYERERGDRYKAGQRQLLREIRKSTDAMPDGAVILNQRNEIVSCNRAASALAGLRRKKDRGQRLDNMLRHPGISELLNDNDATISIDIESPLTDSAWLNCRLVPYGAEQRLLLIRDVTERIRLGRMRRDFVANASHELRSPLTVISGYLDSLAEDASIPRDLQRPIAQMQSQARRMTAIIAELLELSRLESSGPAHLDQGMDVGAILNNTARLYSVGVDVPTIEVAIESQARLSGSNSEIESVVRNLVSNAVRHTPPHGKVCLLWRAGADGAELLVRDDGEGIAAEHLPRLTERFFRVDRGRARGDGGVGLGLAIVKHVLERHEASLQVTSEAGRGSEFLCKFPATRISVP